MSAPNTFMLQMKWLQLAMLVITLISVIPRDFSCDKATFGHPRHIFTPGPQSRNSPKPHGSPQCSRLRHRNLPVVAPRAQDLRNTTGLPPRLSIPREILPLWDSPGGVDVVGALGSAAV
jgi:hypothetical protein